MVLPVSKRRERAFSGRRTQREWTLRQRTTEGRSLEIPGEAFDGGRKPLSEAEMVASEEATSKYRRVLVYQSKE